MIPPAVRRQVVLRDRRCCRVPGCRNATFVDVHHIIARSQGGGHDADNLIVLCSAHHRAVHEGKLLIEGTRAATLSFCHADGRIYGGRGELQRSPPTLASSITISTPGSRPCSQHFCLTQAREGEHG